MVTLAGKRIGLLLFLCFLSLQLFSQKYVFDNYGTKDGLPQSKINDVLQDNIGYLWIATDAGVSRFNGSTFENFSVDNGLAENITRTLFQDSSGVIWIGHDFGKITRFYDKTFHPLHIANSPLSNIIRDIQEDNLGNIWIITSGSGALKFKKSNIQSDTLSKFKSYLGKEGLSDMVYSMQVYRDKIYFHIEEGIKTYEAGTDSFNYFNFPFTIPSFITCFLISDSVFWIGSSQHGLFKLNMTTQEYHNFNENNGLPLNDINALAFDSKTNIIGGTWGGGGFTIINEKVQSIRLENGLEAKKIRCILPDNEGNIWFGSEASGLSYFKGTYFAWYPKSKFAGSAVWSIAQDGDILWLGTDKGISKIDLAEERCEFIEVLDKQKMNFSFNQTMDLAIDDYHNLWIGTWGAGVIRYNTTSYSLRVYNQNSGLSSDNINCIISRKNGEIWCGTVDGISIISPKSNEIRYLSTANGLPINNIMALHEDDQENIWIGTNGEGIACHLAAIDDSIMLFPDQKGLIVQSISENEPGDIWISTAGQGIYKYREGEMQHYSEVDGLTSNFIYFTIPDQPKSAWVATSKNLSKFHSSQHQLFSLDQRDGFPVSDPKPNASIKDTYGNLWIGTSKGLLKFSPELLPELRPVPSILMKGWRVLLKSKPLSPEIELSYNVNHITFDFESIFFSNPEKVGVHYKLDGFEKDWLFTNDIYVTYSYLPPGNYTFLAKACFSEYCSEHIISYPFVIKPPFWQRISFYIIVVLALITGFYLFMRIRTQQLHQRNKTLSEMVKQRTLELQQKNEEIIDSIQYAQNIQQAILSPESDLKKHLKESFILYLPKDIVSGDFYWMDELDNKVFFAAVDCTGHGVPGAFVSIVGHNGLARTVNEFGLTEPAEILDKLNELVEETLRHNTKSNIKDGMDIALCSLNVKEQQLSYAGANNPLYFLRRKGEKIFIDNKKEIFPIVEGDDYNLYEIKADKQPIGSFVGRKKFTNHSIELISGDAVYVFSDGFCDQFGGERGKKFKYRPFKDLLLSIQNQPLSEQKKLLDEKLAKWKGSYEQVDDILVMGFKN